MKLWVVIRDESVSEVKFKTTGCVPAVACGSWLTKMMRGKKVNELSSVTAQGIEAALGGLPSASRHASVLAADALKRMLEKIK